MIEARIKYNRNAKECRGLLRLIEDALTAHSAAARTEGHDYGHSGDIAALKSRLRDAVLPFVMMMNNCASESDAEDFIDNHLDCIL